MSFFLEQVKGIEPSYSAWEADVLPLNYTCKFIDLESIAHFFPLGKRFFFSVCVRQKNLLVTAISASGQFEDRHMTDIGCSVRR